MCVWSARKEMSVQNYKPRLLIDTNCIKAHYINMPPTVSEIDILKTLIQTNSNSALAKHRYTIKLNLVLEQNCYTFWQYTICIEMYYNK